MYASTCVVPTDVSVPITTPPWRTSAPRHVVGPAGQDREAPGGGRSATIHSLDQFLARVATLGEADRHFCQPGLGGNGLAGHDLDTHLRPAGGDTSVIIGGDRAGNSVDRRHCGLHTDLEPVEAVDQCLAEAEIGVEPKRRVTDHGDPGEHLDPAGRLQQEGPPHVADSHPTKVLRGLRLQERRSIGTIDFHDIALIAEPGGVHEPSVARAQADATLGPWQISTAWPFASPMASGTS